MSTDLQVFTLGEVAAILQLPKSRVKNWTIGRPLKIIPKVLAAKGTGSRNLYSIEDVYVMGFIKQLSEDGLSSKTIKQLLALHGEMWAVLEEPTPSSRKAPAPGKAKVLDEFPLALRLGRLLKAAHVLALTQEKGRLHVEFSVGRVAWDVAAKREKGVRGKYILDLRSLVDHIDERVLKLRGRR